MMSYLCNRSTINDKSSIFRRILLGVAKGPKMGPLHFIIYVADMLTLGLIGKILYDDTALHYAYDTPEEFQNAMQKDALALHKWLCRNVLTLNVGKTCYMTFGRARKLPDFNIKINDETIKRVTTYKYLGLVLDDNLMFKEHIEYVPLFHLCGVRVNIYQLESVNKFILLTFRATSSICFQSTVSGRKQN